MKAGLLITFFLTLYVLLGVTNYTLTGTPNNTSDFIHHYYKTTGEIDNPELNGLYDPSQLQNYPDLFHSLVKPFVQNKFSLYIIAVILICLIAPALLYKLAGDFAVIIYFALSLPHMVLFNATFPSFLVFIYILIYFLNRKNWLVLFLLTILAFATHGFGLTIFAVIWGAEILSLFKAPKNFALGVLVQVMGFTPKNLLNIFLFHMNFYFIWVARKKFTLFYAIIFVVGIVAIIRDFRVIALSQLVLCVVAGQALKEQKPSKLFWVFVVVFTILNFTNFLIETERFIFL
jgi:hypothetical protein